METLSVILPSRGRSRHLLRAVNTLLAGGPDGIEVMVGLDADDPTLDVYPAFADEPAVRVIVAPRARTVHDTDNRLATAATGRWLMVWTDDYRMDRPDWRARLEPILQRLPLGLGVAYPRDPLYPDFATLPIVSRGMVAMQGFFLPAFFPFLFGDTWWHEIGQMMGVHIEAPISVSLAPGVGNEHRYGDLATWVELFDRTRPMRQDVAIKALSRIMDPETDEARYLIATVPERARLCRDANDHQRTPEWLARWNAPGGFSKPGYHAMLTAAEMFLEDPMPNMAGCQIMAGGA